MSTPVFEGNRESRLARARGCLLGQLAGDALGGQVEFRSAESIKAEHPLGVRDLVDGGQWNTLAGQPTDDSEMALELARLLVERGAYDADAVLAGYRCWFDSDPFDCGTTIAAGLTGRVNRDSQANGAMMRVSPLGIFGASHDLESVARWARLDAELTHPNPVCVEANTLFARAISYAIYSGCTPNQLYTEVVKWAEGERVELSVLEAVRQAAASPPADYCTSQGWVLIALHNALWQLLNAASLEQGVVDSVMRGGDTDTNAAICGALLGAVYGEDSVPVRWKDRVLNCRPAAGNAGVMRPRPQRYWPVDALELADQLMG